MTNMTTAGINDFCSQPKTYPSTTRYDFTKKARVRAYQLQVIFPSVYRLSLVVWQLGWADLDLDNSPSWMAAIVATYCHSRMEEHLKSGSTQPDCQTTWDTLYDMRRDLPLRLRSFNSSCLVRPTCRGRDALLALGTYLRFLLSGL